MVNVTEKPSSDRTASARAVVKVGSKVTELIKENLIKKGDVLGIAQLAGITGAKRTSELIPLCHNIPLSAIKVTAILDERKHSVILESMVHCNGKTGVEMEALTSVSVAALTVYDMCKAVSHDITISEIYLLSKTGGTKSKDFFREEVSVRGYETTPITKEGVCLGAF